MKDQSQELIDIILPDRDKSEVLFSRFIGCANAPHIVYKAYIDGKNKIDVDVARVYHNDATIMDIPDNLMTKKKGILKKVTVGKRSITGVQAIEDVFLKKHIRQIYDGSIYEDLE